MRWRKNAGRGHRFRMSTANIGDRPTTITLIAAAYVIRPGEDRLSQCDRITSVLQTLCQLRHAREKFDVHSFAMRFSQANQHKISRNCN